LKFEDQALTSFAGLVIFQELFATLELKTRLRACFRYVRVGAIYGRATVFLQLVVHILLGHRGLQESRYYRDDPLVQRVLGLKRLPSVSTLSRMLKSATERSVERVRHLLREMSLERLGPLGLPRVTLEFDGSVQSTGRFAEGTAVGFNKKKKGARSYYPLFCMIAQTGQVLDVLHRPGNVHDSKGAEAFILGCIEAVQAVLPHAVIEVRMDSAFFSDAIVSALEAAGVEFTISVPFERFAELKGMIEGRRRWRRVSRTVSYFETAWKPKSWNGRFRFLFVRTQTKKQHKGQVQLDLFVPQEYGYEFKVIVTNKMLKTKKLVAFHEGRGTQEKVFAELKSSCGVDYVPVRTRAGNQLYLLAGLFAHNMARELQMATAPPCRKTTEKRSALWTFETLHTLRNTLIRRAGRLTRPRNRLTLTLNINPTVKSRLLQFLGLGRPAA
jgi:hypothetical protein